MYPAALPPGRTESRTNVSLLLAIFGLLIAMTGALLALIALLMANGELLNVLLLGLPAMAFGTISYFLGKSATARIKESPATYAGQATAVAGWVIGAISTAAGAIATLAWLVLFLIALNGPPPT